MKIGYTTLEDAYILTWIISFFVTFYFGMQFDVLAILPLLVLLGGFMGGLFLGEKLNDKGYKYVYDEIEISMNGIEEKKQEVI